MAIPRRLSMNTSLKKIFQEECEGDDELYNPATIKMEPVDPDIPETEIPGPESSTVELLNIKEEIERPSTPTSPAPEPPEVLAEIKEEIPEIKQEPENKENGNFSFSEMALITPIKMENYTDLCDSKKVKSVKRTLTSSCNSPYSKDEAAIDDSATSSKQPRLAPERKDKSKKKECIYENDPEVLKRRQKQIDFGKNTVGYDNYLKLIPRNERKLGDPQTPNIKRKYSRRGFDGLVKQWRLKLHKYDP